MTQAHEDVLEPGHNRVFSEKLHSALWWRVKESGSQLMESGSQLMRFTEKKLGLQKRLNSTPLA